MRRARDFFRNAPIFVKFSIAIPFITIFFWVISSYIGSHHLKKRMEADFVEFNTRIIKSLSSQTANDIRYADFTQVKRVIRDFYDPAYMDYLAVYSTQYQPIATYPVSFTSGTLNFMEQQIKDNAKKDLSTNFFNNGHKRFHFQSRIKDEQGVTIGFIAMGGNTNWLTSAVRSQMWYLTLIGFIVLFVELIVIIYLTKVLTSPFRKITKIMESAQRKEPSELISSILMQKPLETTCKEAVAAESVLRKLLSSIQSHQNEAQNLAVQAGIGNIVSHIAHDLRNPLATLIRFVSKAKEELKEKPEMQEYADVAKKCADRINLMAEDLLDYKRARSVKPAIADLAVIVKDALNDVVSAAKDKGVAVATDVPKEIYVKADPQKLHRVIANMLLNAVQASPLKDGMVTLSVNADESRKELKINIIDNGCGIPEENLPKIFDSTFSYGKPKGTGLGLSYCKNVVEAHGGKIEVDSIINRGTRFTITIPDGFVPGYRPQKDHQVSDSKTTEQANLSNGQWLVVEDDEAFRMTWRDVFSSSKLPKPFEVADPKILINSKLDYSSFAGAIVDYNFGSSPLTGTDVIQFLKQKGMKRIYLCSGKYNDEAVVSEVTKAGVTGIISKPLPEDINSIILDRLVDR